MMACRPPSSGWRSDQFRRWRRSATRLVPSIALRPSSGRLECDTLPRRWTATSTRPRLPSEIARSVPICTMPKLGVWPRLAMIASEQAWLLRPSLLTAQYSLPRRDTPASPQELQDDQHHRLVGLVLRHALAEDGRLVGAKLPGAADLAREGLGHQV